MEAPWTRTGTEVLQQFSVDSTRGLTSEAAAKHAELYGKNGASIAKCVYVLNLHVATCRAARGPTNASVGAHPRTVQGPARPHSSRVRRGLVRPGSVRGERGLFMVECVCGTNGHSAHPRRERNRRCHPGNKRGESDRREFHLLEFVGHVLSRDYLLGVEGVFPRRGKGVPQRPGLPNPCLRTCTR